MKDGLYKYQTNPTVECCLEIPHKSDLKLRAEQLIEIEL